MKALPDEVERAFKALLDAVRSEQDSREVRFAAALRLVRAGVKEDRGVASSIRENLWRVAIDAWDDGFDWSIVPFIAGLRDAGGEKLPFEVTLFLFDRVLREGKTKIKPHLLAKNHIQKMYPILLAVEQKKDPSQREKDVSASMKVKEDLAEMFDVSYSVIDQIVSPRPSRQPRKGNPHQPD